MGNCCVSQTPHSYWSRSNDSNGIQKTSSCWRVKKCTKLVQFEDQAICKEKWMNWSDNKYSYFSNFDDSRKFICSIGQKVKIWTTSELDSEIEIEHPDKVHQWWSFYEDQRVISCCHDKLVRLYDLQDTSTPLSTFKGHCAGVISGCTSLDNYMLATGGKDSKTILWDINTTKITSSLKQPGHYTTDMKWMSNNNYLFIQTAYDWTLKLYDTRDMNQTKDACKIGQTIPRTSDIDDSGNYVITGHSEGENAQGDLNLWDLRKMSDDTFEPIF